MAERDGCRCSRAELPAEATEDQPRRAFDGVDGRGQVPVRPVGAHQGKLGAERLAAVAGELARHEVHGLDAVGALIDGRNAAVAHMLCGAGFLDEAHAAMHLNAERDDLDAKVAAPRLDHRDHQIHLRLG